MNKVKYCVLDEQYWKEVSKLDSNIPDFNKYNENEEFKPFFETLFEVDDLCYVACLSSKKRKHYKMNNSLDFIKVYIETSRKRRKYASINSPREKDRFFISVVNLNNMFPVPKKLITYLNFNDIDKYRKFNDTNEKGKYITLLKKESKSLASLNIADKAEKLYNIVCNYPETNQSLVNRCVNFKKIEEFARNYINNYL